jgi:hypothetical protein
VAWASGGEQHSEAEVWLTAVAAARTLYLLDGEFDGFDARVEGASGVAGENLFAPAADCFG